MEQETISLKVTYTGKAASYTAGKFRFTKEDRTKDVPKSLSDKLRETGLFSVEKSEGQKAAAPPKTEDKQPPNDNKMLDKQPPDNNKKEASILSKPVLDNMETPSKTADEQAGKIDKKA